MVPTQVLKSPIENDESLLPKLDGFLGDKMEEILIPLKESRISGILTSNVNMKEGTFLLHVVDKKPLAFIHYILKVWRYRRHPLMCDKTISVQHGKPPATLVSSTPLSLPGVVSFNGLHRGRFVCSAKRLAQSQDLLNFSYFQNLNNNSFI